MLKVRINGSKQYLRFVLDTGSGMSVLSEETAQKLGIKPVARGGMARAVGGGGRFEIVYGYLRSIEIGEVRITNVPVYIRHFFDEKNPVDGYLGIAAISRLMATVDYGTNRLTLSRPDTPDSATSAAGTAKPISSEVPPASAGINVPIRTTASGFLSGEVTIDGLDKPLNFIIDTGATVTVLSEKTAAMEDVQRFIKQGTMRVFGAAGRRRRRQDRVDTQAGNRIVQPREDRRGGPRSRSGKRNCRLPAERNSGRKFPAPLPGYFLF